MTDVRAVVLAAWQRTLELDQADLDADFFTIGGTSLLAARMVAELTDELGVGIGLRLLADHPTVRALSAAIEAELGLAGEAPAHAG